MGLNIYLKDPTATYETDEYLCGVGGTTHNLTKMADEAEIYNALWRPYRLKEDYKPSDDYKVEMKFEDSVTIIAEELLEPLEKGLKELKDKPKHYKQFNAENGWGLYENLVLFAEKYIKDIKTYPKAIIIVSR